MRPMRESGSVKACVWCGASLREGERLRGRTRCHACGVATTDPWPTEAALDAAYRGSYRPADGRFLGIGDAVLRRSRARLARRLDRVAPPGRVLDVGAGDGALVDALRRRGREALGLERESTRADFAERDLDEVEGSWAAIVFWHSLEHLPEPVAALERAAALLAPGGVIVIAVPNSDSLQALIFGDRWLALDLPRHLVHLTSGALLARIRELGLRAGRISYLRGGQVTFGWLEGMVGALPGQPRLYDAIRRPAARSAPVPVPRCAYTLLAATLLLPLAMVATGIEVLARRGGTIYVEARAD
jgi:SAM-dependent methyltransferase